MTLSVSFVVSPLIDRCEDKYNAIQERTKSKERACGLRFQKIEWRESRRLEVGEMEWTEEHLHGVGVEMVNYFMGG